MKQHNAVICGAGIAGISAAYHLSAVHGLGDILLVDERPPLSLTSDKSTECYRNWWPGPGDAMVAFMNRSIDLLEQLAAAHGNPFHLNRRGYLYLTAEKDAIPEIVRRAEESSRLGAGTLRIHRGSHSEIAYQPSDLRGYSSSLDGADLILDPKILLQHYPFLNQEVVAGLHVRRAGWFSAQQLGKLLLEESKKSGVRLIQDRMVSIKTRGNQVSAVELESGETIPTHHFVNAAGPFLNQVSLFLGQELPVYCELHLKVSAQDNLGIIPRDAPLMIWQDPQYLLWSTEESSFLRQDPDSRWLLEQFPPGVHTRPEGLADSPIFLMLWEYHTQQVEPVWPPKLDWDYPEIALRGLARMIPGLTEYFDKPPRPFLDGGYYTKTHENRPLIGPLQVEGAWVVGALSGYGLMASMAAGELLALHLLGKKLPGYAQAFHPDRYQNPAYLAEINKWEHSGQL